MSLAELPELQIGSVRVGVPVVLAPMASVSESPYRIIAHEMGAGLAPTELISSKGLERTNARTEAYLAHDRKREPLLCVQLYGGDPRVMASAAVRVAERGADIIDVNMGCPVKKVTRNGAGSALLLDPARAAAIVVAMRSATDDLIPITAKIRAGWEEPSVVEIGRHLEGAGAAAIAIHGRTRAQAYTGSARWDVIRELVETVAIPVLANGDIVGVDSADRVVAETGCAAVMIGRAALGNPWVLQRLSARWNGKSAPALPTPAARAAMIRRHLLENVEHHGDEKRAVFRFRQHLIWYSRGYAAGEAYRAEAIRLASLEDVLESIEAFFGTQLPDDPEEAALYDERAALG